MKDCNVDHVTVKINLWTIGYEVMHNILAITLLSLFVPQVTKENGGNVHASRPRLYMGNVQNLTLRYLHDIKPGMDEDEIAQGKHAVYQQLLNAGQMGLYGLVNGSLSFEEYGLESTSHILFKLGILSTSSMPRSKGSKFEKKIKVEFIHKSIQEYLAAFYAINTLKDNTVNEKQRQNVRNIFRTH